MQATAAASPRASSTCSDLPRLQRARVLGEELAFRQLPAQDAGGSLLVALHGLGSDSRDVVELARHLGLETLLVDLPGFGFSARVERAYPVGRAAEAVVELLERLGHERGVWLGTSYGAHVALRAALDAPERVERLLLLSPGGLDPDPPQALIEHFAEERLAARTRDDVARALAAIVGRPSAATDAFSARRLSQVGAPVVPGQSDLVAVARSAVGALACDVPRRLHEVEQSVDLFHGERDALIGLEVVRAAAARFARARLHTLPGLGHLPWLEDVAEVATRVTRALATPHFAPTSETA